MRNLIAVAATLSLAACSGGGGDTTGPTTGTIQITTVTSGVDGDFDGYDYSVDGGTAIAIANTGSASATLPPGSHTVTFTGVAANCSATSATAFTVTVASGQASHVDFTATCQVRYSVIGATTGSDLDVAYLAAVDGGPWNLVLANGPSVPFAGLAAGSHTLHITGVAPNCVLTGSSARPFTVLAAVTVDPITVTCSATTRLILFGSTRDGGYDLYTMHADGTGTVRLTTGTPTALHGRWSPDGTKIVYHSASGTGFDIVVMNANGTSSVPITSDGSTGVQNLYPDWSPDGSKIVFQKGYQVWSMDPDGSHATMLTQGTLPRYSPDGNTIAFDYASGIWLMNSDGSNARNIQPVTAFYNSEASWSPDGTKILFISPRDGAYTDIFVMNTDGTGVVNLTNGPGGQLNENENFSPDGTKIAFRTNRNGGNPEIYVMNANGSSPVNIAPNIWDEYGPAWHP